jgi:RNA polymerase sigma factor (sigma-70 family)
LTTTNTKIGDLLSAELKPLTRLRANGEILTRPPEVESLITETLELDWDTFVQRSEIVDQADSAFVKEEVLVFLFREALRAGNSDQAEEISTVLFRRVGGQIEKYGKKLSAKYSEEAAGDMFGDLFLQISDTTSDKSDFAQVKFGKYLKRICYGSCKKYWKREKNDNKTLFFDQIDPETEKPFEVEAEEKRFSETELKDVRKGLNILPEPNRTAFILRHYEGLQVESKKPDEWTISKHFGKTERTIRNWLNKAENLLDVWRTEQRGES